MKQALLILCILSLATPGIFAADDADSPESRQARSIMIRDTIARRGIANPLVLQAMQDVPRHYFVPENPPA